MPRGIRKDKLATKLTHDLKRVEDVEEVKEILAEVIQKKESPSRRIPGSTVRGTKVGYNYQDLCSMFPIVSWTPEETVPLIFQGVQVQAFNGIEMHVPKCFKDIYDRHRRERKPPLAELRSRGVTEIQLGGGGLTE